MFVVFDLRIPACVFRRLRSDLEVADIGRAGFLVTEGLETRGDFGFAVAARVELRVDTGMAPEDEKRWDRLFRLAMRPTCELGGKRMKVNSIQV